MIDQAKKRFAECWQMELQVAADSDLSRSEMARNSPIYTPVFHLGRFIAHFKIFEQTLDVPGAIVELGVYRGSSLMTWAKLCEMFCPRDFRKTVFGFDTFAGFPRLTEKDGVVDVTVDRQPGGYNASEALSELERAMAALELQRTSEFQRVVLVPGDVCRTAPEFVTEHPNLRISLLHLDLDLYEPTLRALEAFYPWVVPGGVVVLDAVGDPDFPGACAAVEEFFRGQGLPMLRLRYFHWQSCTPAYFVVESN